MKTDLSSYDWKKNKNKRKNRSEAKFERFFIVRFGSHWYYMWNANIKRRPIFSLLQFSTFIDERTKLSACDEFSPWIDCFGWHVNWLKFCVGQRMSQHYWTALNSFHNFCFVWMLRHDTISCASEALRPQNGCVSVCDYSRKAINAVNNINQLWLEPKCFNVQMINFCCAATVSFP